MRFVFKTTYDKDINWFTDRQHAVWYILLLTLMLAAPLYITPYFIGEVALVLIYSIAAMGLMLLTGHTGLPSLGHAAFMAMGCFANVLLLGAGVPWIIAFPLCGIIAGAAGTLIMMPVLRLHGVYLALATLALSILIADIVVLAEPWTGGVGGTIVPTIDIFGWQADRFGNPYRFYYVTLATALVLLLFYRNLLRAPLGRSFLAIRDSEVSAQAMGISLPVTKAKALFLSAGFAGLAGALFGHSASYVNSETFDIVLSINLLLMIVIGGLGFIHGAFLGAIVFGTIPLGLAIFRTWLASDFGININIPGLEIAIFAAILMSVILFEPAGLYGRWLKIRTYFQLFPFYRRDMFRRQKSYLKTERVQ